MVSLFTDMPPAYCALTIAGSLLVDKIRAPQVYARNKDKPMRRIALKMQIVSRNVYILKQSRSLSLLCNVPCTQYARVCVCVCVCITERQNCLERNGFYRNIRNF